MEDISPLEMFRSAFRCFPRLGFQVLVVKNPPPSAGDVRDAGLITVLERSPGGGHGNPLQYSCLENPMDRGAWMATVHRVAKSQTCLKQQSTHACMCGTDILFQLHHPSLSWRSCYKLFPRPSVPPGFVSSLPPEPLPHHISYPPISTPGLPPLCSISALPM